MTPAARLQAVIDVLEAVAATDRPADGVIGAWFKERRFVGSKDRRDIAERVYGILRRRARLDWWLARIGIVKPTARRWLLADLAIGERAMPEDLQPLFGRETYGPPTLTPDERGLVARLSGQPLSHGDMPDWVRGEYPGWIEPALRAAFGEDFAAEVAAMREEAPLDLRVNTLKATRDEAIAALADEGVTAQPTVLSPIGLRLDGRVALSALKAFRDGLVEVQDEGSQLVALLTDARPGQAVVDYCAGAGGKTLALAAAMRNKGRLIACDVYENRMARAQERMRRAGVHNVTRRLLGAEGDKWMKRNAGSFDRVLVDAPCSGTGTWRRNPDARWRLLPEDLDRLAALQADILARAAKLVRPGGRLIYATCSVLAVENEGQVRSFLAAAPNFGPQSLSAVWTSVIGGACPSDGPWLRLSPARHGTDGFFVAVMERALDSRSAPADQPDHQGDDEKNQKHEE
ncbi:MAG: RsmB/NOP family class I SAM-dependent RNA methyltransferase [Rhodospirillales bacterium]|nr:RsmB/NOP family class I SAM-dependent RNA methyltransferase [Rhodospirillales bacterium]